MYNIGEINWGKEILGDDKENPRAYELHHKIKNKIEGEKKQ